MITEKINKIENKSSVITACRINIDDMIIQIVRHASPHNHRLQYHIP
jgi:hypothetical protein